MITIKLTDGYYIEREGRDHVLKQIYTTQPKGRFKDVAPKEAIRDIGYFSNLESALERYLLLVQSERGDGHIVGMGDYIETINRINQEAIAEIIKVVGA